ncbi:MAG TPA: Wzz/FepE/Etk N-terminal domain-containing protein, partial [Candidatus Sulfopaludibacter sp.]|nr:Wzz/FepE/Etk N-terminal domain-containing protein [Candidatus Sulfopaludibacter sp.]
MAGPIDAFRYMSYMRSRWRLIAASCGIAVVLALGLTLIQTRQYTATARIVIEPPAGSDLRAAMAVSPIYLESLRTYEEFASSDSLFQKALGGLDLRPLFGGRPIESVKKRVLKVELVRNTRILEISATLPDARKAHALASFLAESTVDLNRKLAADSDQDLLRGLEQQQADAHTHLDQIDTEWAHLLSIEPVDDLKSAIENAGYLRSNLQQEIVNFQVETADSGQREKQGGAEQAAQLRADAATAGARIAELR